MHRSVGSARRPASRLAAAVAGLAAMLIVASPVAAGTPGPHVMWERDAGPDIGDNGFPQNDAFEPIVATHPTDPARMAFVYHRYRPYIAPVLRVTNNTGSTWRDAGGSPWWGSGRAPNWHAAIAWGPGPTAGSSRLYWADTTTTAPDYDDHLLSISSTDNEGASWSSMYVERRSAATPIGGFPDITVDRDPKSPNYGVVYAVYNWFPNESTEPGITLLASRDYGRTWAMRNLPAAPARAGYPWAHRIGARVRAAPDGSVYVSFYQADLSGRRMGRMGFGIVRVRFDRATRGFTVQNPVLATTVSVNSVTTGGAPPPGTRDYSRMLPRWSHGLDVQKTGRVFLAVADYRTSAGSGSPRGIIKVGRSDDFGRTWRWTIVPPLPRVNGYQQSAHKPTLVVSGATVFVGYHSLLDVPWGTSSSSGRATVGNAFATSYNGGGTFASRYIKPGRWDPEAVDHADYNGAGLRDRAEKTADGHVIFVYGSGRHADRSPSPDYGESHIYASFIQLRPPH